jgi:hypothetical protein
MFHVYEQALARTTLVCAGNHYGKSALTSSGEGGQLLCAWPQPRLVVNTPDKLELIQGEIAAGLKSYLMGLQDWYDVGRNEALEILEQMKADQEEVLKIFPDLRTPQAMMVKPAQLEGPAGEVSAVDRGEQTEVEEVYVGDEQ